MPRSRPRSNTSATLAHFLLYLRITHKNQQGHPQSITQGQLARKLGYRSASVVSELEDPAKCRATYHHLERYADYFGIPVGVMLLITRITATVKYGCGNEPALQELPWLKKGVEAITGSLESHDNRPPTICALLKPSDADNPVAWEVLFERLLSDFRRALPTPTVFQNAAARRRPPKLSEPIP